MQNSHRTAIISIFIISLTIYSGTIFNDFVYDDEFQVQGNKWITEVKYIQNIFFSDVLGFLGDGIYSNYYRPVMYLIYMGAYFIFGLNPWGFHLINILLHAGVSVMVFELSFLLLEKSITAAFLSALFFALHPIHTEVVAWVGGIPELSFVLFGFLAFYYHIMGKSIPKFLFFFISILCKETAFTFLPLMVIHDFIFKKEPDIAPRKGMWDIIKRYFPYFVAAALYFILRINAIGVFAHLRSHAHLNFRQYFINIFPLFVQYLEKLLLPLNLNAFHVFRPVFSAFERNVIIYAVVSALFMIAFLTSWKKNKTVFFCLSVITIPLIPVLIAPVWGAFGENVFAERYLYLPSFGFVMLFSLTLDRILKKQFINNHIIHILISIFILTVIVLYSSGTLKRNHIWKNEYNLMSDSIKKSPDSYIAHVRLGAVYARDKKYNKAIEEYLAALKRKPDYPELHFDLASMYYFKGCIGNAIEEYKLSISFNPLNEKAHYNLATLYAQNKDIDSAIKEYQAAIRIKPDYLNAHNNLGVAYYQKGQFDNAIEHFQIALRLDPNLLMTHKNIAAAYKKKGLNNKALEHINIAKRFELPSVR